MTALVVGGAVLPVLARNRFPSTALLATTLLFGWYPAAGATLALTSYCVAARTRSAQRRRAAFAFATLVPFAIGLVGSGYQWRTTSIAFGVAAVVCVVGPAMVQVLLGQRERLILALREQTGYLRANHRLAASAARLQERSHIAQEMHDLLGHRLSLISLYAGSLELDASAPRHLAEPAVLIRNTARTAMQELRATLGILRQPGAPSSATQPTDQTGTWADVAQLVQQAQAGGVRVELRWSGGDLAGRALPIRQAVHRIIREGLTNVCRHAAGAQAEVVVAHGARNVHVVVRDDGCAGSAGTRGSGLGLVGVQERVRLLGGTFQAGPRPGRGFEVSADLPLASATPAPIEPPAEPEIDENADSRWARAGMSAVLATGLVGAAAILVVTFTTVTFDSVLGPSPFDSFDTMPIGSTRDEVAGFIGRDDPVAHRAARGAEPRRPEGTDCWYSFYYQDERAVIERYCFRQDLLVDKTAFDLPLT